MTVLIYPDAPTLAMVTATRLCLTLADAAAQHTRVHLAIAGGSVGSDVLAALTTTPVSSAVPWESVHVWWVDERFVPDGDVERNDTAVLATFTDLGVPAKNLHRMPSSDNARSAADGADAYRRELARLAPAGHALPVFEVVLLGMGPDGHIASLFPGHPGLSVDEGGVPDQCTFAVTDSPKPPAERISLSLAAINHARRVWIAAWGEGKANALARAVEGAPTAEVPASGAGGQQETLWLTDIAGAGQL